MNQPWVYICSPSWIPLPPTSPSYPSGSSQCSSPEHPVSCIEPGLVIYFIYDYTCFNAILSNHPTLAFSHRVQKSVLYICVKFCSLHLCLSCCLSNRVIVIIFLDSIYVLLYCIGIFLSDLWEGNRQEGQGSPNGGNRLQVPDIFISLKQQEETNQWYFFLFYTNLKGGFS